MNAEHPLTGRKVALFFVLFFGLVAAVNAVMIRAAVSTFSGEDSKSPYEEGLAFNREISAAGEQNDRHWQVDVGMQPLPGGAATVSITAKDSTGNALAGLDAEVRMVHPVDARLDRALPLTQTAAGHFQGTIDDTAHGAWDLDFTLRRGSEQQFRSISRIVLK
jgi:nitrogen fixation protein FixH